MVRSNLDYINTEFIAYVNRHLVGIILLKDKIRKVSLYYELSEAYSNHACRCYIDVDFDYAAFTNDEQEIARKYFYTYGSSGGSWVSIVYKTRGAYRISPYAIGHFIRSYQFAECQFEEVIAKVIPSSCYLDITRLKSEPFFNYISGFVERRSESFEADYFVRRKRHFDFDCYYHDELIKKAEEHKDAAMDRVVTDEELCSACGSDMEALRTFIVENDVPFLIEPGTLVIEEIKIDQIVLKSKLNSNAWDERYPGLKAANIIILFAEREQEAIRKMDLTEKAREKLGVEVGDYILIGRDRAGKICEEVGVIKRFTLSNEHHLYVHYNNLKTDLSESQSQSNSTALNRVSHFLKANVVREGMGNGPIQYLRKLLLVLKQKGLKNPEYVQKQKRRSS